MVHRSQLEFLERNVAGARALMLDRGLVPPPLPESLALVVEPERPQRGTARRRAARRQRHGGQEETSGNGN